ncbi:MAG TPA: endonuclease III [Candidatus Paceibacterota bacterium]
MKSELLKERQQRFKLLWKELKKLYPEDRHTELHWKNPWELVVSVALSAQCTDKKVNEVTAVLFKKYPTPQKLAKADLADVEKIVYQTGFYKAKAKNIIKLSQQLLEEFNGEVPQEINELTKLAGVGRKTAQVVRAYAFNIATGMPVDTHVKRFALRYNLTDHTEVEKIEKDLLEVIPKETWIDAPHKFIAYGRRLAPAKPYDTSQDPLIKIYPPAGKIFRVN